MMTAPRTWAAELTGAPFQVAKHNTPGDLWVIIGNEVYDLTQFASAHPGGSSLVLKYAGREATKEFLEAHPLSIIKTTLPNGGAAERKGTIAPGSVPVSTARLGSCKAWHHSV